MIKASSSGDFKNTIEFLDMMQAATIFKSLDRYGRVGVDALSDATPVDTGETAHSWSYKTNMKKGYYSIDWYNTHREGDVNIAVIIQYGHGTGTGGWVQGRDYINPAMRPIFDKIVEDVWRQVKNG